MLVDVVADTEELAKEAAYYAFIRLFIGPYPGRKTTAGNAAAPIMPVVDPGVRGLHASRSTTCCRWRTRSSRSPCASRASRATVGRRHRGGPDPCGLYDAAEIVRSKNAGPFAVTIDLFFDDEAHYDVARPPRLLTPPASPRRTASRRTGSRASSGTTASSAAKVSLVRWSSSSDPFCTDLFGAHLHTPLAAAELV